MARLMYVTGVVVWCAWGLGIATLVALHLYGTWKARRAGKRGVAVTQPRQDVAEEATIRYAPTVDAMSPARPRIAHRAPSPASPATIQELTTEIR